ncbi:MAG: SsrA-binding protein SmpB [Planctomycetes bacterium]|nr:SsrA-binding protein SmpB [Planctomycetota bacterium]
MAKKKTTDNNVCQNKKAIYRFEILETLECGIALLGTEVKSLREKNASIDEAHVRIDDGQLWLVAAHIAPYSFSHHLNHEPTRKRKLLAHTREIHKLQPKVDQRGFTLIPLRIIFNARGLAKVVIGLARGKTMGDKRETLKAREHKREIERETRRKSR